MRKHYIDNLRSLAILLLFPVHTFMIWNDFGSRFYIWEGENKILSTLIVLVNPWFMPLLFVLAGMSARYALGKRSEKEFAVQKIRKLGIPFLSGLALLVPVQTLYARKYFAGYEGGYWENLKYFFTHITDLSGYDGAFTPGHLWFILFLFLIAMATLPLFRKLPVQRVLEKIERTPVLIVLLLFLPVWGMYYLGNFGGFSLGKNFALYLLGYYVLSNDSVLERLEKYKGLLYGLWLAGTVLLGSLYYAFSYYGDLWICLTGWISILALLVAGKNRLNIQNKCTNFFRGISYPVYLLHQSILVAVAYYVVQTRWSVACQALGICLGSFLLTVAACSLLRRIPGLRVLIGMKG